MDSAALEAEVEALRERVRCLEKQLSPEIVPPQLGLTAQERRIASLLLSRQAVRTETLMVVLGRLDGEMSRGAVRVHVSRLRQKLPRGAAIRANYGDGYWMDEASKALVRGVGRAAA